MRQPGLFLITALILAASACGGSSSDPADGSGDTAVVGTVRAPDGSPVEGALVSMASADDPTAVAPDIALSTGPDGRYRWELEPGSYEITISKDGFHQATKRVTLQPGTDTTLNFTLERA